MQPAQKLTRALRSLLSLVDEEAARNPAFATRLESVIEGLPVPKRERTGNRKAAGEKTPAPDVIAVFQQKGEEEFRFWLRSLDLKTLRTITKANGFDPAKASLRWKEPDKFVALIAEQVRARLRRGSGFLPTKSSEGSGTESLL